MKKKIINSCGYLMLAGSVACYSLSGAYAYKSNELKITSTITTGDVDIAIQENQISEDGETLEPFENNQIIVPGDTISKIVTVKNLANPCYLRMKVVYAQDASEDATVKTAPISEEKQTGEWIGNDGLDGIYLNGISADWVNGSDGYFYYTKDIQIGESIQFFESVSFPKEWTERSSEQTCQLDVTAEAVQAANFQPDFMKEQPWGDTEIELCLHENDGSITSKTQYQGQMAVSLDAQAAQMVSNTSDFFQNLDTLMPGDTVSDTVYVKNQNDHAANLFFHTETPEDLSEAQMDLLKNLQLSIQVNGNSVYEGNLESTDLNEKISLGLYEKGSEGKIDFSVSMPKEDKNVYAVRDTDITWVFDCGWDDGESDHYQAPKTGLEDHILKDLLLAGTCLLIGGISVLLGMRKQKN